MKSFLCVGGARFCGPDSPHAAAGNYEAISAACIAQAYTCLCSYMRIYISIHSPPLTPHCIPCIIVVSGIQRIVIRCVIATSPQSISSMQRDPYLRIALHPADKCPPQNVPTATSGVSSAWTSLPALMPALETAEKMLRLVQAWTLPHSI